MTPTPKQKQRADEVKRIKAKLLRAVDNSVGQDGLRALHDAGLIDGAEVVAEMIIRAVHLEVKRGSGIDFGVLRGLGIGVPPQFLDDTKVPKSMRFKVIQHVSSGHVLVRVSNAADGTN